MVSSPGPACHMVFSINQGTYMSVPLSLPRPILISHSVPAKKTVEKKEGSVRFLVQRIRFLVNQPSEIHRISFGADHTLPPSKNSTARFAFACFNCFELKPRVAAVMSEDLHSFLPFFLTCGRRTEPLVPSQ